MLRSWYKKTKQFLLHTNELNLTNREVRINGIFRGPNQRFLFKKRLGKGGFGAVYEAIAPDGKRVAVKVTDLRSRYETKEENDRYFDQYFDACWNEFSMLWKLTKVYKEKRAVKVYDIGTDVGPIPYVYMIMDIGDGSLHDIIDNLHKQYTKICGVSYSNEYIPAHDRKMIWKELVEIVATLGRHGISHMDLKPANILRFGNTLKVCDLGISQYGSGVGGGGTANFSPPEALIMNGQHDPRVDIWSMGAILYYMTYGKQPNWNPDNRNWDPPYGYCQVQDPLVQNLLEITLQYDMENRPDINTILKHPYTRLP